VRSSSGLRTPYPEILMAKYVYKGLTDEEKSARVAALTAKLDPPEQRGQPRRYHIDKDDSEDEKELKRKLTAEWKKAQVAAAKAEVEKQDSVMAFGAFVFEKGKPVDVLDGTDEAKKLEALCGLVGVQRSKARRAWEKLGAEQPKGK
jgi:hypothetical protein